MSISPLRSTRAKKDDDSDDDGDDDEEEEGDSPSHGDEDATED
jgi:hypothetical protein